LIHPRTAVDAVVGLDKTDFDVGIRDQR
jgi:hypothetical protein